VCDSSLAQVGDTVLVDDGLIALTVDAVEDDKVHTTIRNSGWLSTHKGVNLPGAKIDLPAVTERDKADIAFGVRNRVDFIAASFIRSAANVEEIRNLPGVRDANIKIISKIESAEGVQNFIEILKTSDGIMVARGDLAVEIPLEKVPAAQKMMIRHCNQVGKIVITATQMMESMTNNPRPTRAEVTDVANAVFDGTDCVMLSGESANGKYPSQTVETMMRICREAEKSLNYRSLYKYAREGVEPPISQGESIASSTVKTAWDIQARLILGLTESGRTSHLISKYRPNCPVLCVATSEQVARQCLLFRSLFPFLLPHAEHNQLKIEHAIEFAKRENFITKGDLVVVTSGVISGNSGGTNTLSVETVN
jgi:pyruvate kinase